MSQKPIHARTPYRVIAPWATEDYWGTDADREMYVEERKTAYLAADSYVQQLLEDFKRSGLPPMFVWPFYEAPACLRELSRNGGDEDWLLVIPPIHADKWVGWAEVGTHSGFGCCAVNEFDLPCGAKVRIGCHA